MTRIKIQKQNSELVAIKESPEITLKRLYIQKDRLFGKLHEMNMKYEDTSEDEKMAIEDIKLFKNCVKELKNINLKVKKIEKYLEKD